MLYNTLVLVYYASWYTGISDCFSLSVTLLLLGYTLNAVAYLIVLQNSLLLICENRTYTFVSKSDVESWNLMKTDQILLRHHDVKITEADYSSVYKSHFPHLQSKHDV